MITSAFQMNTTVWIKFYIPFAGDSTANVDAHFKSVKMIVNMHYINDGNSLITSLNPIHSFEDIVRVFFSKDEYLLWERAAPSPHLEPRYLEKLHTQLTTAFDIGQFDRAYYILMFLKIVEKNQMATVNLLRINETLIEEIYEAAHIAESLYDLIPYMEKSAGKFAPDYIEKYYEYFRWYIEVIILQERNVFLESLQPIVIQLVYNLEGLFTDTANYPADRARRTLKIVKDALSVMASLGMMCMHDVIANMGIK